MDAICFTKEFEKFITNERANKTNEWKVFEKIMLHTLSLEEYLRGVKESFETLSFPVQRYYITWSTYGYLTNVNNLKPEKAATSYDQGMNSQGISTMVAWMFIMSFPVDILNDKDAYTKLMLRDARCSIVDPRITFIHHCAAIPERIRYNGAYISRTESILTGSTIPIVYNISNELEMPTLSSIIRDGTLYIRDKRYMSMDARDIQMGINMMCIKWQMWLAERLYSFDIISLNGLYVKASARKGGLMTYMGSDVDDNLLRNTTGRFVSTSGPKDFYIYEESRT